ncbi:MAG TPA: DUF6569 family protein [Pirellulales bacterium]|jgi:hypothetical protein
MPTAFPQVRVGEPICHDRIVVFPLFSDETKPVDYVLAADAIEAKQIVVEEISEAGSVPNLSVTNDSDHRVLFLEGEQLVGAKQNRILNTSLLVAAKSKTTIPVSCVEQGRWGFKSKHFGSSDSYSPSKIRSALKASVSGSLSRGAGHTSDQGRIWQEVATRHREHDVTSGTAAMEDIFEARKGKLAELQKRFAYVPGATGVAIALGNKLVAVDMFDKPTTCHKVWERLLSGVLLDSLVAEQSTEQVEPKQVEEFVSRIRNAPWLPSPSVGEGEEVRAETDDGVYASALYLADDLVHGSVAVAD